MFPYLFEIELWGVVIRPPTYGFFLALAFSSSYFSSLRRAVKLDEEPRHVENLFLVVILCSILGSRLFHVFFEEFQYYLQHPLKVFAVWEGGYTLYGALLTSLFGVFLYCRIQQLNFLQFGDIAAPATCLGIFLGRLGCFGAGCCWGKPTHVPWAVTFTSSTAFTSFRQVPVHPTQLYESFGALLIYFYLQWLFRRRQFPGEILFNGLILYGILRFMVEFFRGDAYRGYLFGGLLSYSQFISLLVIPFASYALLKPSKANTTIES